MPERWLRSRYTADPPAIATVDMEDATKKPTPPAGADVNRLVASGKNAIIVKVTGSGFRVGTTARWTPVNAKEPLDLPASSVEFVDSQTLKITLVPGDPGTGAILMLLTPNGFSAATTVTVA